MGHLTCMFLYAGATVPMGPWGPTGPWLPWVFWVYVCLLVGLYGLGHCCHLHFPIYCHLSLHYHQWESISTNNYFIIISSSSILLLIIILRSVDSIPWGSPIYLCPTCKLLFNLTLTFNSGEASWISWLLIPRSPVVLFWFDKFFYHGHCQEVSHIKGNFVYVPMPS